MVTESAIMTDTHDSGIKRFRSPPYPSIDLAKALERAHQMHNKALHHPVQANVLADAWAYGIKSSGLWATAAALIQYGLMTDQGSGNSRRFQLTDTAIRILRDADQNSTKRWDAIKRAALSPAVFAELYTNFGSGDGLSDAVIRNFLTLDRHEAGKAPYSDASANDLLRAYKATIAYAGIADSGSLPADDEDKEGDDLEVPSSEIDDPKAAPKDKKFDKPPPDQKRSDFKIMAGERELTAGLLSKGANFRLIVSGQIGVKEIERLIAKLEIDKEILAETDDDLPSSTFGDAGPFEGTGQ
jgi:uncharacterized protein YwgA